MKLIITIYLLIFFNSQSLLATNIRVIDLNYLLNENILFKNFLSEIEEDQKDYKLIFKNQENELKLKLEEIEELKLILDSNEFQKEINKYNNEFNLFNSKIQKFNMHYESQLNNLKNKILNVILELLKNYSSDNKIDLILDSNSYIISDNSINITNFILDKLNKVNISIDLEKYK